MSKCEGTVVSAAGGSLTFTDMVGKQITFKVADNVPVTVNGQMAKLSALKAGMRIRVTLTPDEQVKAVTTMDDHKLPTAVASLGLLGPAGMMGDALDYAP